MSQVVVVPEDL